MAGRGTEPAYGFPICSPGRQDSHRYGKLPGVIMNDQDIVHRRLTGCEVTTNASLATGIPGMGHRIFRTGSAPPAE